MVKNTSVRARSDSDDALRGIPFKGVGVSREKVRFRLVKAHHKQPKSNPSIRGWTVWFFSFSKIVFMYYNARRSAIFSFYPIKTLK